MNIRYLKNIIKVVTILPALMLAGCANDDALIDEAVSLDNLPDEVKLTLNIPQEEVVTLGSTRAEEPALTSVTVMCYDNNGNGLSTKTFTSGWSSVTGGYEVTVSIHKRTRSVQLVTNAVIADNPTSAAEASMLYSSDATAGVLWGKAEIADILSKGSKVDMLRQNARVSVTSSAPGFTLKGIGVYGTATEGSLAPTASNMTSGEDGIKVTAPTTKADEPYTFNTGAANETSVIDIFETPATTGNATARNCARVIVRGEYNGSEYFYPVAFRMREGNGFSENEGSYTYTPIAVLRNHHYKISILDVKGEGWTSYDGACKAEPDNRLSVLITDCDDSITDITSNRDYMLGIGGDINVAYNQGATVTVLTSYIGEDEKPVFTADQSWVRIQNLSLGTPETVTGLTEGTNSTGKKYTVIIPLDPNDKSTTARTANVTVRVGDLSRTFKLTQSGRDYKRDVARPVILEGLGITVNDYFNWIDNSCHGLKPEQNRGVVRNEGLHFPAVPAYTLTYKIKALSGDQAQITDGAFNVSTTGGYHVVTVQSNTASISVGTLQVTTADGTKIDYPLYKTGYFHQLTASTDKYQREDQKIHGWFYYEVVKVGSKYILDRNLGAANNSPYITTYAAYRDNTDGIGAYFKISETKSTTVSNPQTIISYLGVSNFKIPTQTDVKAWNVSAQNVSGTTGELAKVATIATTGSLVKDNIVFLPHGGYYEGTDSKYDKHANIWTRTLLSGNQGFAETSPEFGYWYLYFDCYGTSSSFSNMRFCLGSAGQVPDENSVYKYMPIRLQWQ